MSKCKMSFPLTMSAEDFLEKAKAAIGRAGGVLTGTPASGSFHLSTPMGKVAGEYTVANAEVSIVITDKPMLIGCGMIEGMLRSQLS